MDAMTERRRRQREIFDRLFDCNERERLEALGWIAQSEAALAEEVRLLLERADRDCALEDASLQQHQRGQILGRFRIVHLLGEGGMGTVYFGERVDEVRQKVAIKVVNDRAPKTLERAKQERQILAYLSHPNIAGLIDAGQSESGQPWIAMEFVSGVPITTWCDRNALGVRERAAILETVCIAVHFAHRNLVLHRDIKPSNIYVNDDGVPKLLDFGIAKMLGSSESTNASTTSFTLAYAAPEQLRGAPLTTASDVYQLGMVLFELMTGVAVSPHIEGLRRPRLDDALSAAIAANEVQGECVALVRHSTLERLLRMLRGELSQIVRKATSADPAERYDSAQALADDLSRWRAGLPVLAHRGSFVYRARKFLRRHRLASVAVTTLGVGLILTSVLAVSRAHYERVERMRADTQLRRSQVLLEFLRDIFQEGDSRDPKSSSLSAVDLLDRATARANRRGEAEPATQARLSAEIAAIYSKLGQYDKALAPATHAVALLEPLAAEKPADYLAAVHIWVNALNETWHFEEACVAVNKALPITSAIPDKLVISASLLRQRAYARWRQSRLIESVSDLNLALKNYGAAGVVNGSELGDALNLLAAVVSGMGDPQAAIALFRRGSAAERSATDQDDPMLRLTNQMSIAGALADLGKPIESIQLVDSVIAELENLGIAGAEQLFAAHNLVARAKLSLGEYSTAKVILRNEPLPSIKTSINPGLLWQRKMLMARAELLQGNAEAALPVFQDGISAFRTNTLGTSMWQARSQSLVGEALLREGRIDEACAVLEESLNQFHELIGDQASVVVAEAEDSIGRCRLLLGDYESATTHLLEATRMLDDIQGSTSPSYLRSRAHLLWSRTLATSDPTYPAELLSIRTGLLNTPGGATLPQLDQLQRLEKVLRPPSPDGVARPSHADQRKPDDRFVGLNSMY